MSKILSSASNMAIRFASGLLLLTLPLGSAHAIPIMMEFTATDFMNTSRDGTPAPDDPVSGTIVWDADSILRPTSINYIISVDLTIDGHSYSLDQLAYNGHEWSGIPAAEVYIIGARTSAYQNDIYELTLDTDDFRIRWGPSPDNMYAGHEFAYTSSSTLGGRGIPQEWSSLTFTQFSITAIPVSNTPPVLNPITDKIGSEGIPLEFTLSAFDADGDDLIYSMGNSPEGAILGPVSGLFQWTPIYSQSGNYENIQFSVTDNGDPIEVDTQLITITIGDINRPPVISPIGSIEVEEGYPVEFTVNATDPDEDIVSVRAENLPRGSFYGSGVFTWLPDYTQAGVYNITFAATDDGSPQESSEINVLVTVGNTTSPSSLNNYIIDKIISLDLSNHIVSSYLANLKKVNIFIEAGKTKPAYHQVNSFLTKVESDLMHGHITQDQYDCLFILGEELKSFL